MRIMNDFYTRWADDLDEERKPLDASNLDETFAGIRHHFLNPNTCILTCTSSIDQLKLILVDHPLDENLSFDCPIAHDALPRLFTPPCATLNPLVPEHLHNARRIIGLTSFVSSIRTEVILAFKVLARFVNERRFTHSAWREIRRLAKYLVSIRELGLTLIQTNGSLSGYVDSSLNNGPDGRSYGGFALQFSSPTAVSGSFLVSCNLPPNACDSSGATELFQSVRCVKAITGIRTFLKELGFQQLHPTIVFTDARVLIDGTRCKRISFESKWVAPRMAMIRFAEKSKGIFLTKVPTGSDAFFNAFSSDPRRGVYRGRHVPGA